MSPRAWFEREQLVWEMRSKLYEHGVQYSCLVVSGVSGLVIGPQLAERTGRDLVYVRKYNELTKNKWQIEGTLTSRWVFVDDFVATGRTFANVCADIRKNGMPTVCVGILQYVPKVSFSPIARAWELQRSWNHVGMKASDIPGFVETKRTVEAL